MATVPADRAGGSPRDIVRHPGGSVILPLMSDDQIVMIRNRRVAVDDVLWELPAGTRGPGEDPAAVAARELEEETGYRAARIEPFGWFFTTPGFTDERLDAYIARDLTHVGQHLDPGESIDVHVCSATSVVEMIDDGRIRDAKTIAVVLRWMAAR
ncbi:MAG: NUDIX hydrolase [Phycisphaerales bacterium]